jgi:hemerythrin
MIMMRTNLSFVLWSPKYDTDNPDVNREHQALFAHVNRFYLNLKRDKNQHSANAALEILHAYSTHHF